MRRRSRRHPTLLTESSVVLDDRGFDEPTSTVEEVFGQLIDDQDLYASELTEVMVHANAVRNAADFRLLQAASLMFEEREADYLERVDSVIGTGQCDTVAQVMAEADRIRRDPRELFGPDGVETAICEVGAAMTVPPARARQFIEAGSAMRYRLPGVGKTLAAGRIDLPRLLAAVSRTDLVDDEHVAAVDAAVAESIMSREPMSMSRFTTMVDSVVARIDPDAVKRRQDLVEAERNITIRPDRRTFGQSCVSGTLPSDRAAAIDARLTAMAADVHSADPRGRRQRRADALVALARGEQHLTCTCEACAAAPTDKTAASEPEPTPEPVSEGRDLAPRPTLHIVVDLETLLGHQDTPAMIDGQGLVDADTARTLLAEAKRTYVHPHNADTTDTAAAQRYPISDRLRGLIGAGELCCTFPGCNNAVWTADLDHTDPFNHTDPTRGGPTTQENLTPLCRFHHRHKTFAVGWRDYQTPLGEVYFHTPTGYLFEGNAFCGRDLFTGLHGRDKSPHHPGRRRADDLRTSRAQRFRDAYHRSRQRHGANYPAPPY